jgi:membrane-associated phospholipid phosphatase
MSMTYTERLFALLEDHRPISLGERIVAGALAASVLAGIYGAIAVGMVDRLPAIRHLPTWIDDAVPFTPFGVLPYAWIFPQAIAPLAFIQDRRVLARTALAYVLMISVGIPFWVFLAVTVPRVPLVGDDLWTWGVGVVRWVDPPTNCFPSMHVAESFLSALLVRRLDRPMGNLLLGLAFAVWWSTVAIGQHWFLDGVAGAFLAVAANHLVFAIRPLPTEVWRSEGGRARFGWIAAVFGVAVLAAAAVWASGQWPVAWLDGRW